MSETKAKQAPKTCEISFTLLLSIDLDDTAEEKPVNTPNCSEWRVSVCYHRLAGQKPQMENNTLLSPWCKLKSDRRARPTLVCYHQRAAQG